MAMWSCGALLSLCCCTFLHNSCSFVALNLLRIFFWGAAGNHPYSPEFPCVCVCEKLFDKNAYVRLALTHRIDPIGGVKVSSPPTALLRRSAKTWGRRATRFQSLCRIGGVRLAKNRDWRAHTQKGPANLAAK